MPLQCGYRHAIIWGHISPPPTEWELKGDSHCPRFLSSDTKKRFRAPLGSTNLPFSLSKTGREQPFPLLQRETQSIYSWWMMMYDGRRPQGPISLCSSSRIGLLKIYSNNSALEIAWTPIKPQINKIQNLGRFENYSDSVSITYFRNGIVWPLTKY